MARILAMTLALLTLLLVQSEARAQSPKSDESRWRIGAGAGIGFHVSGHELSDPGEPAGVVQAFVERRVARPVWLGLGWTGAWLRGAPGGDSRQALLLTLTLAAVGPLELRAGGGLAIATTVEVDGPPDPPLVGDAVIAIGSESGGALSAGLGFATRLASWLTLTPGVDLLIHRVGGQTLGLVTLSARAVLQPGAGSPPKP